MKSSKTKKANDNDEFMLEMTYKESLTTYYTRTTPRVTQFRAINPTL